MSEKQQKGKNQEALVFDMFSGSHQEKELVSCLSNDLLKRLEEHSPEKKRKIKSCKDIFNLKLESPNLNFDEDDLFGNKQINTKTANNTKSKFHKLNQDQVLPENKKQENEDNSWITLTTLESHTNDNYEKINSRRDSSSSFTNRFKSSTISLLGSSNFSEKNFNKKSYSNDNLINLNSN